MWKAGQCSINIIRETIQNELIINKHFVNKTLINKCEIILILNDRIGFSYVL